MSRYAFLIGANGPKDSARIKQLQYAQKDVELLAQALEGDPCRFTAVKQVKADSIKDLQGLAEMANLCRPDDLLLVHFSGHAIFDEKLYLILNDTDATDAGSLMFTALKVDDLKAILRKCKARAKALILDCCHSAGAYDGTYKGSEDIKSIVDEIKQGSGSVILAACSRKEKARELDGLDGGAGFLTWAIRTGCTIKLHQASPMPQLKILSLEDMCDRWIEPACKQVSDELGVNPPLPKPYISGDREIGTGNKIWLTDPPPTGWDSNRPIDSGAERKKYLENVYSRYRTVTLPIGPKEGFGLQDIYQRLNLRPDPLLDESTSKQRQAQANEVDYDQKSLSLSTSQFASLKKIRQSTQSSHYTDTIEEALSKSEKRRMVVLGGPGSGKTTTLKYLVSQYAQEALDHPNKPVPIFLSLADFARSGKTLRRYLEDVVEGVKVDKSYAGTLWTEMQNGNALLAMDSLDEVESEQRTDMVDKINDLVSDAGNIWLISSRFAQYKGGQFKQRQFIEWELLPMVPETQQQLADKLFALLHEWRPSLVAVEDARPAFEELLRRHTHADTWGENPLLFSLAAIVFMQTGGLPLSRAMLYREVIDAVLSRRQTDPLARDHLLRLFMSFALWLQQFKEGRTFTREDIFIFLEDVQRRAWSDVETITEKITQSGIIDEAGDIYSFRHRTFQEYLAAAALARQMTSQNEAVSGEANLLANKHRTHSRWTEVLRMMFGILAQMMGSRGRKEAKRWRDSLLKDDDPGMLGLELALKSLTEIADIREWRADDQRQLETSIAATWLDGVLDAAQDKRVARVDHLSLLAEEIKGLHTDEITGKKLLEALRTQDSYTQEIVIELLKTLRIKVPQEYVMELLQDAGRHVRHTALEVVRVQKDRISLDKLRMLLSNEKREVRDVGVRLLQEQGEYIPVTALLSLLEEVIVEKRRLQAGQDISPWNIDLRVRYAIVAALWKQRQEVSLEQWLMLLTHSDEEVRYAMVYTLCSQESNPQRVLVDQVPIERWLALLKDTQREIRAQAAEMLRERAEQVPVECWLALLHDENEEVCVTAVLALGERGEPPPLEPLLALLNYDYANGRRSEEAQRIFGNGATEGLVSIQPAKFHAKDDLYKYVNELYRVYESVDSIALVRTAALEVLKRQKERLALEQLKVLLKSQYWKEREAATLLLSDRGEVVPIEIFLTLFQDEDKHVRKAAAQALREQGERVAIEFWKELVKHEDGKVREIAVQALQARDAEVSEEFWVDLLMYPDWNIRTVAVGVLCVHEEVAPIELLLRLLRQGDGAVRAIAAGVLKRQEERVPIEALLALLKDEVGEVRAIAVKLLEIYKDKVAPEQWFELLEDEWWRVRMAVIQTLSEEVDIVPLERWIALLGDESGAIRYAVIQVIGKHKQKERLHNERKVQEALLDILTNTNQEILGVAELVRLRGLDETEEIEECLELLMDEETDWHRRHMAIQVLQGRNEQVPTDELVEWLETQVNADWNVRRAVVQLLRMQGSRVGQEVWSRLREDVDPQIKMIVLELLQEPDRHIDEQGYLQDDIVEARDVQDKQDGQDRQDEQNVRTTREIEEVEKLEERREVSTQVANEQADTLSPVVLGDELSSEKALSAQPALREQRQERELRPIENLLKVLKTSNHRDERNEAIEELNAWGEKVSAQWWQELLEDKDEIVRAAAIDMLCKSRNGVSVEGLLRLLYHKDRALRLAAIQVLEAQHAQIPSQQLRSLIADKDEEVRGAVLHAIKKGAPAVLADLMQPAKEVLEAGSVDDVFKPLIERTIAETIMKLELVSADFFEILLQLMEEQRHWQVRIKAIEALSRLRHSLPDNAIQRLLELRRESGPYMDELRKAADDALAEILTLETGIEDESGDA